MAWQKQPVEVTLRNGRRFRTEIDVEKPLLGSYDREVRHAIALLHRAGGVWYKGNFINWGVVFSVCRVESLEAQAKTAKVDNHGKGDQ